MDAVLQTKRLLLRRARRGSGFFLLTHCFLSFTSYLLPLTTYRLLVYRNTSLPLALSPAERPKVRILAGEAPAERPKVTILAGEAPAKAQFSSLSAGVIFFCIGQFAGGKR